MFFVGLVLIWDTQQQPRTIQIITGLILRPKMGWNCLESNLQRDLDICWKNAKNGGYQTKQLKNEIVILESRNKSFSDF